MSKPTVSDAGRRRRDPEKEAFWRAAVSRQRRSGLGVRVYRDGRPMGFWEAGARALQAGDTIVEIVPTCEREADHEAAVLPERPPAD